MNRTAGGERVGITPEMFSEAISDAITRSVTGAAPAASARAAAPAPMDTVTEGTLLYFAEMISVTRGKHFSY